MDSKQIPRPDPDVIWRVLDGEAVLVSPRAGHIRVLNEVGTTIWGLLDGQRSVGEIRQALVEAYDVAPDQAASDLQGFLDELAAKGLLTR